MASKDQCAATVRLGATVVRAVGAPEGSTVGHEAAVLIDSFRLGKAYPIENSSTDHKVDREALLRWWKDRGERAKPGTAEVAQADPPMPDVPLAKAVEEFNEAAGKDPVGKDQPALTAEEVVAAIRAWKLERERRPKASDEVFAAVQKVAATGSLPPGAKLGSTTGWVTTDYEFDVWWVDLEILDGKGGVYTFRVRDRKIASRPVQKR